MHLYYARVHYRTTHTDSREPGDRQTYSSFSRSHLIQTVTRHAPLLVTMSAMLPTTHLSVVPLAKHLPALSPALVLVLRTAALAAILQLTSQAE